MSPKQRRDIAISVAEEDLNIAKQIALALKDRGISYYLYTEHRHKNWGKHILGILFEAFRENCRYVLMITSKTYVEKYWTTIEHHIMDAFSEEKGAFTLQLRLDDTPIEGLRNIICEDWDNNAAEIADIIKKKLEEERGNETHDQSNKVSFFRKFATQALIFVILVCIFLAGNDIKSIQSNIPNEQLEKTNLLGDTGKLQEFLLRCQQITKQGTQCKRTIKSGKYCWQHGG